MQPALPERVGFGALSIPRWRKRHWRLQKRFRRRPRTQAHRQNQEDVRKSKRPRQSPPPRLKASVNATARRGEALGFNIYPNLEWVPATREPYPLEQESHPPTTAARSSPTCKL